jgi:hypothetical protein
LFFLAVGIGAFLIAFRSGNKSKAILIPALVASICWMIPILIDPKALGTFGIIGLVVFVLLAFVPFCVGGAVGCVAGLLMRDTSRTTNRPSMRQWAAVGILVAVVVFAGMQIVMERNYRDFLAVAEVSGATFLRQQEVVLSRTGPVIYTSVFARGRNQYNLPSIVFFVKGEIRDADVCVAASGTKNEPVYSIQYVELRPK